MTVPVRVILFSFVCSSLTLVAGCGDGTGLLGGGGLFGGGGGGLVTDGGGVGPAAPTGGSGTTDDTPVLGGNPTPNPPLDLVPTGGSAVAFDSDAQAVLAAHNTQLLGDSLTPERIQMVLTALQLYKHRQHSLTFVVSARDRGWMSGLWSTQGGGETRIDIYSPDSQHTMDHEVAHDMTLYADTAGGGFFESTIDQYSGYDGTWPSSYSQTNGHESMAEILSFLAEAYAGVSARQPWSSFNPPAPVQDAAKRFMSQAVLSRVGS